jgi:cytochrome c-type biogenesis protein CcmH/NrfG
MPAPFLLLALFLQQGGAAPSTSDPARAVIELQEAIRKNPDVESNYTDLGNILLRTQNFGEAALVLEAARSKFPESAQAALSAGVAYYGLRRFSDAVAAFLDAGKLDPDAEQPISFLSRMAETWGNLKSDVIDLFSSYAKRHPRSALANLALGRATADAAALQRAIKLNPKSADAHFELGVVLEAGKDFPAATKAFERAAQLAPKNPVPHYRLARLYARAGDSAKAEAERALHEKLAAEEKARLDARQAATKHLDLKVRP